MQNATLAVLAACLALAPAGSAQKVEFKLDHLTSRAREHTVVDMDAQQLRAMAAQTKPGKERKLEGLLDGIESLRVNTFEFDKDGQYSEADLAPIRKQLQAPGWTRIASVKEKNDSTEVYLMMRDGKMAGLAVISAEPRELNVVNIVGTASLDRIGELVRSKVRYDLSKISGSPAQATGQ